MANDMLLLTIWHGSGLNLFGSTYYYPPAENE